VLFRSAGIQVPLLSLGLPDVFTDHGDPVRILANLGLDAAGIERSIRQRYGHLVAEPARPATIG
jgi:1-deoxy-D-xylulose-5-phosphate synthase